MDSTDSTPDDESRPTTKPSTDPTLVWLEEAQANNLRMTLDPEFRRQVEQRLLFRRQEPGAEAPESPGSSAEKDAGD